MEKLVSHRQEGTVWKLSPQNCGKPSSDKSRLLTTNNYRVIDRAERSVIHGDV